ncbi:MAG: enoyl-CoA hydratase/isomerase family protein [Myxococcota bacterium]
MRFQGTCLSFERQGAALEVLLHADPCNEIGLAMLGELERVAEAVEAGAGGARAVIFRSDRKGFCAGADLRELQAGLVDRRSAGLGRLARRLPPGVRRRLAKPVVRWEVGRFLDRIHRVFDTFDTAPLLTVAVTHGTVFGGGFELALTADVIVAEQTSRFCFPELRLGLIPGFGGIPRLERDLGNAVIRDLLLSGRSLGAQRAYEVGLVSQVVPTGKGLDVARKLAEAHARFEPATVRRAKAFLKPLPRARLDAEKREFLAMVTDPAVLAALTRFVEDEGLRPYL